MEDRRWQLASIYGGLRSEEYLRARAAIEERLGGLEALIEEHALGSGEPLAAEGDGAALVERALTELNALLDLLRTVTAYLTGLTAADAFDDAAQAEASSLRRDAARRAAVEARLTAYLGRFEPGALVRASQVAADHHHFLREAARRARHLMSDREEALAATLNQNSGAAWERLHDDLIARDTIVVHLPEREAGEALGVSTLMNLQCDPDRAVRQAAYLAETKLLERNAVAHAAAMNGIKGQVGTLSARRAYSSALEQATVEQGITPRVLSAMQEAVQGSFPTLRRFMRHKARLLGVERLAWFDRRAPLPQAAARRFTWQDGQAFVAECFEGFTPRLADYARRCVAEGWIDVPPRAGKSSGAFCLSLPLPQESRVLLNWGGSLDDVLTLAHELGHGYLNDCTYRWARTSLQTRKPMTMAETASMFCETLVVEALLERADTRTRLAVLDQALTTATAITIDIHSRFLFERAVFERRRARELSVAELDALMLEAQDATYGDAVAEGVRFAKAWAEKPHYYSSSLSFYNFPYTFGYLFGLGLYARARAEPDRFKARYDEFLASTGMAEVAELTRSMGCDVEDPAFWEEALAVVRMRVDQYAAVSEVPA